MNWFNVNLQTFSWTDSIWVFKCPCCFVLYSQRLQEYWTFSWTDSLWVFKIPCVVALYSYRLHGYTQLLPALIQYESSDVPVSQSCQKNSRSTSTLTTLWGEVRWSIRSDLGASQHFCTDTNFEYFCYKCDKVFMESIQPELSVRKL